MVSVTVDLSHLHQFGVAMPQIQKRGMEYTALDLVGKLMNLSPVDHGLLRQWTIWRRTKDTVQVRSPAYYAKFQNYGTYSYGPAHRKPKTKAVGGIKPKKFVEESIEMVKPRIEMHFKIAIREVLL